ncbi:MAG: SagB/ThcOx family dehydrogenase [Candidatus Omnitrophica bacterium]|nr:SagB/ThcOx family dehydrogenase [Candidatus Omnitrophota bacterium]
MKKLILIISLLTLPYVAIAEDVMKEIKLPAPSLKGNISLEETLQTRRSIRNYSEKELSLEQISQLLWSAQGITNERGFRTSPSAGARFPLELYLATKDGLFKYVPQENKLVQKNSKDVRKDLSAQGFFDQAPIIVIFCAVYERVTSRYGQRGVRYVDMEVGHAAENLHLQAVSLGLGSVPVGAFNDDKAVKLLELPENEVPLYFVPVGYES